MQQHAEISEAPLEGCACPDCVAYESGLVFLIRLLALGALPLLWIVALVVAAAHFGFGWP